MGNIWRGEILANHTIQVKAVGEENKLVSLYMSNTFLVAIFVNIGKANSL